MEERKGGWLEGLLGFSAAGNPVGHLLSSLLWGKGTRGSGRSHLNCRFWSTSMGLADACDCSGDPPKSMECEALLAVVSNTRTGDSLHALGPSGTFMVRIPPELSEPHQGAKRR